jgi:hypothetical protein
MGHVAMKSRHGLLEQTITTQATDTAERDAATEMVGDLPGSHPIAGSADNAQDTAKFVAAMRDFRAPPACDA